MVSKKSSNPRPIELRLSPDAAQRINRNINLCNLKILQNIDHKESKIQRIGRIAIEAESILAKMGEPIGGCSEESIEDWLNLKRGKSFVLFQALCQAIDEDWFNVFDRNLLSEILSSEQRRAINTFMDNFFDVFTSSPEETSRVLARYRQPIEKIIGSSQIEPQIITDLIEIFLQEFAFNGRQVRFRVSSYSESPSIASIEITGNNQENNLEIWSFYYAEPYLSTVETKDWWWKGDINIQFQLLRGKELCNYSCKIFIPPKGYLWADIVFDLDTGICEVQ